ncbi:unnamed protein product [Effrenium voratum]|uniref:RING-type domain-containing protein n=1 Tax=Effrenium voratum TaxID=2562239 RepID=A0AA36INM6_9DINO|nr:unnamed protein product [Effrenium voratum]
MESCWPAVRTRSPPKSWHEPSRREQIGIWTITAFICFFGVCVEDPASCPICWEDLHLRQAVMRCCGRGRRHYFHFGCGQHWIEAAQDLGQTPSCPVCRNQLQVKKAKLEQLLTGGEDALEEHDLVGEWANECIPSHWEGMSLAEKTGYAAGLAAHAVLGFSQAVHAAVGLAQAKPRLPRVDVLA